MKNHPLKSLRLIKGTALIMALFVMSLVAVAAVAMITRLHIDIRRTSLLLNANQAYLYAQGSVQWAKVQLINNLKQKKQNQLVDKIPIISEKNNVNGYVIQSTIYDAQAYFNVNNLADSSPSSSYLDNFQKLLQSASTDLNESNAKNITQNTRNWINPNATENTADVFYAKQTPPYSAPHRLMASASELRLVVGMTSKISDNVKDFVIALPESTPVNVNTASAQVLSSLSPTMSLPAGKTIETYRKQLPFVDNQQFLNFDIVKNNPIPENKITVISNYFLVKTNVKVDDQEILLFTLLKRTLQNSKPSIDVLWQTKGTL